MAVNINTILSWFKTGKKPTESQFAQTWGSFWHKDEIIPQASINSLTTVLNAKAEKSQFDLHKTDPNAHPEVVKKARIIPIGESLVFKVFPNENTNEKEPGDFCLLYIEGSFVMGHWNGSNDQLKTSYE